MNHKTTIHLVTVGLFLGLTMAGTPAASAQSDTDSIDTIDICDLIEGDYLRSAFAFQPECNADQIVLPGITGVGVWADAYPNGQFGYFDCIYDSAANRSIIVERWSVHVELATINSSGTYNWIIYGNVYYPFVDTAIGNAC